MVEGQAGADGPGRTLDAEARPREAGRRRFGAEGDGDRHPGVRVQDHIGIDRRFGLIRIFAVTHAAAHDGGQLEDLLDPGNLASSVAADTAYRSAADLALLDRRGLVPPIPAT